MLAIATLMAASVIAIALHRFAQICLLHDAQDSLWNIALLNSRQAHTSLHGM